MLKSKFKSQNTSDILVLPKDISNDKVRLIGMGYDSAEKLYDNGDHFTVAFYSKPDYKGNVFYIFGYGEIDTKTLDDMDSWESDEFDRKNVKSIRIQDKNNHKSWVIINGNVVDSNVPNFNETIKTLYIDTNNKENLESFLPNLDTFEHKNFIISCVSIIILLVVVFATFVSMKLIRTGTYYLAETPTWYRL